MPRVEAGVPRDLMAPVFCPLKKAFIIFCGGDDDDDDVGKTPPRRALWAPGDICQRRAPGRLRAGPGPGRGRDGTGVSGRCRRRAGARPAGGCSPAPCRAGNRVGLIEGLVTVGPPPPHLLLGEGRRVLLCSSSFLPSQGALEGRGGGIIFVVVFLRFRFPPRCLPGAAGAVGAGGDPVRQEGGEGLTSVATPRMGKGSASPFARGEERPRGSATSCPLPPAQHCLAQVPSPPSPPPDSEGRRGEETTSGRGLAGRCRPRSPRAALSDRPGNRGPIPPAAGHGVAPLGFGPGGSRRSSLAEPGNPLPAARGQNSSGRRGGGCQPGGQPSGVSIAGRAVSRLPHALGGSGLAGTGPPSPGLGCRQLPPRGRAAARRARSLSGASQSSLA